MHSTKLPKEAGVDGNKGVHTMKNSIVIGIDLVKTVIHVCKINRNVNVYRKAAQVTLRGYRPVQRFA